MTRAVTQIAQTGQWSRTGLDLPAALPFDEWLSVGEQLRSMEQSVMWWIGDWLIYGEAAYAERFAKAAELTGHTIDRLKDARRVSAAYAPAERSEVVSWSHYRTALRLPRDKRGGLLREAEQNGWSCQEMRYAVARFALGAEAENHQALALPASTDRHARWVSKLVADAFCDWFAIPDEYGRIVLGLYQAGRKPQAWRDLARVVSTHQPMTRGAVHEAISTIREAFECEAIDRDDDGYWLTEIGQAECRHAFRELGQQLIGMGQEPANEA